MMSVIKSSVKELYDIYFQKRVYRYAAAFSYYVTLSLFPIIILVSIMVAPLHVDVEGLYDVLSNFIPRGITDIILSHLDYVRHGDSDIMLWSAVLLLCSTASGAFRVLMNIMSDIHGESRYSGVSGFLLSFVLALSVLLFIYLSCVLVVTGRWVLNLVDEHFQVFTLTRVWLWLRYGILFPLMFFFVQCIYMVTMPKGNYKFRRTTGAILATVVVVLVSMIFSWLISLTNRYTLVYGSLASVVILMIWLYCCGIILIMGNAVNVVIDKRKHAKQVK